MGNEKKYTEIIERSHRRSIQYGIEKEQVISKKILNHEEFKAISRKNRDLIRVTIPLMQDLYDFLSGSGYILVLTDRDGCILNVIGDPEPIAAALELDMVVGAYMDEKSMGTNAMGTAISENAPIQISAMEHFITAYHRWTCSAAPIHDPTGIIIGTLNLTGASNLVHSHTLGMVVAAVRSIELQIQNERANNRLVEADRYNTAITNSISHGILAVTSTGVINSVNRAGCTILKMPREGLLNTSIDPFIEEWEAIYKEIQAGNHFEDEEVTVAIDGKREKYLFSAFPIPGETGNPVGMVLTLKEIQKVINLVNRYTGMQARYTFEDIIGESSEIRRVIAYARQAADSPATILVQGESGTGKEVLAQAIHNDSSRRNNGFVAINCGAIHRNLIESELFGYEEGAFTGAKKGGQPGKFELASGGTLFLDEIGEMPLELQVNLLRVLQEGYVMRVGSNKCIPVNVRIIAATNKNLNQEIERGNFRQDLFYRISVIPIHVPPLRERMDDIACLTDYFVKTKSEKLGKRPVRLGPEVRAWIQENPWKGNIRELENFVEKLVILEGHSLSELVGMAVSEGKKSDVMPEGTPVDAGDGELPVCSLEELENRMIQFLMKRFSGNVTRTADVLGISRNTLYLKMKKFGIEQKR